MMMRAVGALAFVLVIGCNDGGATQGGSTETGSEGGPSSDPTTSSTGTTETSATTAVDSSTSATESSSEDGPKFDVMGVVDMPGPGDCVQCSSDFHAVQDCRGGLIEACMGDEGCDPIAGSCRNACDVAQSVKQSVGCDYYAVFMSQSTTDNNNACFAVFIANTWDTPAHLTAERGGMTLDLEAFTGIPDGSGPSLTYDAYDDAAGLAPGEVAVLFLSGPTGVPMSGFAPCPMPSAIPNGVMLQSSGIADAFHITSDVPVVAYEINPYGGGSAAVTGASLLLPTSAWDTNYVLATAGDSEAGDASLNIIAFEDDTTVTINPIVALSGGGGIPSSPANTPVDIQLDAGQHAQIDQTTDLTGSILDSNRPVGVLGGNGCLFVPDNVAFCDHAEQMIPPVRALGSRYVGVMYRSRWGEPAIWRVVGAVDGTALDWSEDVGGPDTIDRGEVFDFETDVPFVVESQGSDHPFMLFSYMSGSTWPTGGNPGSGYGDADFVISVPTEQYMPRYVFFADPTYPETSLVVVRARGEGGAFLPVNLDCYGNLDDWTAVGNYEWTRIDLTTGDFMDVGGCSTGRHEISSDGSFGLWVWGWGTPETSIFTENVSYGYPGGMNVQPINDVVIPPQG